MCKKSYYNLLNKNKNLLKSLHMHLPIGCRPRGRKRAHRKVAIVMVIDPNVLQDSYSKIEIADQAGIPIFVYNPQYHTCKTKKRKRLASYLRV